MITLAIGTCVQLTSNNCISSIAYIICRMKSSPAVIDRSSIYFAGIKIELLVLKLHLGPGKVTFVKLLLASTN